MSIKLSKNVVSTTPSEMGGFSEEMLDTNIGYGSGVNSNPSSGEFRTFLVDKIVSKVNLERKKRKMKNALDFLQPSVGMSDWSGDSYSRPLDPSGRDIR